LDNAKVFTARRFRVACRDYQLAQEFITPYITGTTSIVSIRRSAT
jgi:transposase InsO family protein